MEIKSISLKDPNGIKVSKGNEVLKERIARIIMTSPQERLNNPMFGTLLHNSFLFDLSSILQQNVEFHLRSVIEKYEPRVTVDSINIDVDGNLATIRINLIVKETFTRLDFETTIEI